MPQTEAGSSVAVAPGKAELLSFLKCQRGTGTGKHFWQRACVCVRVREPALWFPPWRWQTACPKQGQQTERGIYPSPKNNNQEIVLKKIEQLVYRKEVIAINLLLLILSFLWQATTGAWFKAESRLEMSFGEITRVSAPTEKEKRRKSTQKKQRGIRSFLPSSSSPLFHSFVPTLSIKPGGK